MSDGRRQPVPTVVLVEPICRGSRLQILANALTALKDCAEVIVVTRSDYATPHFDELVTAAGLSPRIVAVQTNLGGAWMKSLRSAEFEMFLRALRDLDRELAPRGPYDLVFMALDDYLVAFARAAVALRAGVTGARVSAVKYRVEYLFSLRNSGWLRGLALRALTRWSLFAAGAKLICFDERLAALAPSYLSAVLPDPWFGEFAPSRRGEGRRKVAVADDDRVLLTLGKQDRRKGFDFLIHAFPKLPDDQRLKLVVVGRVDSAYKDAFARLLARFPNRILHVDAFVPEADLPAYFACADAFLLPYSAEFTATSGTLARAAASGVPVLASAHGLVGYRVRHYGLGETFDVGDVESFMRAVATIDRRDPVERDAAMRRGLDFAVSCALPRFEAALRRAFCF